MLRRWYNCWQLRIATGCILTTGVWVVPTVGTLTLESHRITVLKMLIWTLYRISHALMQCPVILENHFLLSGLSLVCHMTSAKLLASYFVKWALIIFIHLCNTLANTWISERCYCIETEGSIINNFHTEQTLQTVSGRLTVSFRNWQEVVAENNMITDGSGKVEGNVK